jgi:hypothetical protein
MAVSFESGGQKDLGRFLEYLDAMEEKGLMTAAESGNTDCVSIMSIHKSKGLEFPVVFLCRFPEMGIILFVQPCHILGIAGNGFGLGKGIPVIADCGIQQQGQPYKKDQDQQWGSGKIMFLFHAGLSLPLPGWGVSSPTH